ncbi:chaperonin GroEL [Skermanella stibiiresistens]|nr:chaperonin GroEL [Skermanella stibiiresistens]
MTARIIRLDDAARAPLMRGVDLVADLATTAIGPAGRAVLAGRNHTGPAMMRGGHAISQEVEVDDPGCRAGVAAMRQVAWRTSDAVGDGTCTAILIARGILREGMTALRAGISPGELEQALRAHGEAIASELRASSRPAVGYGELVDLAVRAAGGDTVIGTLAAEAHRRTGREGVVIVTEGQGAEDDLEVRPGLHFDEGWLSPHFATDAEAGTADLENPLILLHHGPIERLGPLLRVLEMMAEAGRSLLICAGGFGAEALGTLIVNKQRAGLKVVAVKAPGAGLWRMPMLEDIAAATGATVIADAFGTSLDRLRPAALGRAESVRVTRDGMTLIGGAGDPDTIALRRNAIRLDIERERHLSFDREQHRQRLARLSAGVAKLHVGGQSETVIRQRTARAAAASAAIRAAPGGLVPGGSAALLHAGRLARKSLPAGLAGRLVGRVFDAALGAPTEAIMANAGLDGRAIRHRLAEDANVDGFDVERRVFVPGEMILDPAEVLIAALRTGVSAGTTLFGVGASVAECV